MSTSRIRLSQVKQDTDANDVLNSGSVAAGFGVAIGSGALFIFGEVPRVRNDILRKLPFFDTYYDRTVAPEDNVSQLQLIWSFGLDADFLLALLNYSPGYIPVCLDQYEPRLSGFRLGLYCRIAMKVFSVFNTT